MLTITGIPAFSDNYIWCLADTTSGRALVVDPGQAAPVKEHLRAQGLTLDTLLITHHHPDHTGGVAELSQQWPDLRIVGPAGSPFGGIREAVSDGDSVQWDTVEFRVIAVPGHTLDHIAFFSESRVNDQQILFSGDALFVCGCGRLFEGKPAQMLESLTRLRNLPDDTAVYCAHEYTLANLRYARHLLPEDGGLARFEAHCKERRNRDLPTVPSTLGDEKVLNPFLRWDDAEVIAAARRYGKQHGLSTEDDSGIFAAVRHGKDHF